jgi:hypothetical protein
VQSTDPPAAAVRRAELDRRLADLAISLPAVTPNEVDLLSRRMRNYQYNPYGERSSTSCGSGEPS